MSETIEKCPSNPSKPSRYQRYEKLTGTKYTVQQGDRLYSIAKQVMADNPFLSGNVNIYDLVKYIASFQSEDKFAQRTKKDPSFIRIGQVLVIPTVEQLTAKFAPDVTPIVAATKNAPKIPETLLKVHPPIDWFIQKQPPKQAEVKPETAAPLPSVSPNNQNAVKKQLDGVKVEFTEKIQKVKEIISELTQRKNLTQQARGEKSLALGKLNLRQQELAFFEKNVDNLVVHFMGQNDFGKMDSKAAFKCVVAYIDEQMKKQETPSPSQDKVVTSQEPVIPVKPPVSPTTLTQPVITTIETVIAKLKKDINALNVMDTAFQKDQDDKYTKSLNLSAKDKTLFIERVGQRLREETRLLETLTQGNAEKEMVYIQQHGTGSTEQVIADLCQLSKGKATNQPEGPIDKLVEDVITNTNTKSSQNIAVALPPPSHGGTKSDVVTAGAALTNLIGTPEKSYGVQSNMAGLYLETELGAANPNLSSKSKPISVPTIQALNIFDNYVFASRLNVMTKLGLLSQQKEATFQIANDYTPVKWASLDPNDIIPSAVPMLKDVLLMSMSDAVLFAKSLQYLEAGKLGESVKYLGALILSQNANPANQKAIIELYSAKLKQSQQLKDDMTVQSFIFAHIDQCPHFFAKPLFDYLQGDLKQRNDELKMSTTLPAVDAANREKVNFDAFVADIGGINFEAYAAYNFGQQNVDEFKANNSSANKILSNNKGLIVSLANKETFMIKMTDVIGSNEFDSFILSLRK